jgi:CubicO group peptidase (beta-lactamase class C family)
VGVDAAVAVVGPEGVRSTSGETSHIREWASVTKLVTSLAALVAVEEGSIALDEPAGPPGATVRHLLAHTSGLPFDAGQPIAKPGARRIYSNLGFEVLAEHLAKRAGMPWDAYAREAVLEPLGMRATRLDTSAGPGAGASGPVDDLAVLGHELLRPTLISAETHAEATTVQFPGIPGVVPGFGRMDPCDWGLGFELRDAKHPHWTGTTNSPRTFGHFGRAGSFLWVDPDADLALAYLSGREFEQWAKDEWPELSDAVLSQGGRSS